MAIPGRITFSILLQQILISGICAISVLNLTDQFTLPPLHEQNFLFPPSSVHSVANLEPVPKNTPTVKQRLCSDSTTSMCNQAAWTDFGLSLSGILVKYQLCLKYVPSDSCVSLSLAHCLDMLNPGTRAMMVAFAKVVVSWCYDGGHTLTALNQYTTCYGVAVFESIAKHGCLTGISAPHRLSAALSNSLDSVADPQRLLSNFLGSYQSSTIICLHEAIEKVCGVEAAELSLGPAMNELRPTRNSNTPTAMTSNETDLGPFQPEKTHLKSSSNSMATVEPLLLLIITCRMLCSLVV